MAKLSLYRTLLSGPRRGPELAHIIGVSQPTFSRLFQRESETESIRAFGAGKRTVYGAIRELPGIRPTSPIFRIDESGNAHALGEISAVERRGFILEPTKGPPRIYPGVPYFLSDARPQGYLGRAFANRHADLGFPARVPDWSEDQIFAALALRGEHLPGNLIVGEESFRRLQTGSLPIPIPLADRAIRYESLAEASITGSVPGSSAAGEQAKFPAYLAGEKHVLVKFSPKLSSPKGRRWGDLLLAEALALETIAEELSLPVAPTEIVRSENRIFLESERFDRIGERGRKGCLTFASIELEWIGSPSTWAASAKQLLRSRRISKADAESIQLLDAFGALIANTDRHYGNLAFFFDWETEKIGLAPAYDVLPMLFAPKESEESEFHRNWMPPLPDPNTLSVWERARSAARVFWEKVAEDSRISPNFREIAKRLL